MLGAARVLMAAEDHGAGQQLVRVRWWPRCSPAGLAAMLLLGGLAVWATLDGAAVTATILGGGALLLTQRMARECFGAMAATRRALDEGGVGDT